MSSIEYELFTKWQREFILRKCLQKVKDSEVYDYILIDAPPTLGGCGHEYFVRIRIRCHVPVEASPWGMFGLANMFEFLNEVREIRSGFKGFRNCSDQGRCQQELFQTDYGNTERTGRNLCFRII